jgi:hypothetical protein
MVEEERVFTPSYAICVPFKDVLREGSNITSISSWRIVQETPPANESIVKCSYRGELDLEIREYSLPQECNDYFAVDKFVMSEFVCFRIQRRECKKINLNNIVNSLHSSTEIYSFDFSESFSKVNFMKTIVFTNDVRYNESATYPNYSRVYGSAFRRLLSEKEIFTNSYISRYTLTELYLQPPPYDTMCVEGAPSRSFCVQKCMIKMFVGLERTPPMEIIKKPSNFTHFSSEDYKDQRMRDVVIKFNKQCEQDCRRQACNTDYSVTFTQGYLNKELGERLRFTVATPAAPATVVQALIKQDITEFLTYLFSCFGIWFGVSVFSINPKRIKPIVEETVGKKVKGNRKQDNRGHLYSKNITSLDALINYPINKSWFKPTKHLFRNRIGCTK